MKKILLLIKHQQNRDLLAKCLQENYHLLLPKIEEDFIEVGEELLQKDFDVCLIDFAAVHLLRSKMLATREAAIPTFLPFVFLTPLKDVGISTDHLEALIDDIIYLPIKKIELETKIRVLLRSRSYSLQLKAVQEELNQSLAQEQELNKLKTNFVSTVSHELRNPLNGISGMAQLLTAYGDKLSPEKKAEVLAGLQRNVIKMTNLLDDVLTVSRKEMGKLQFNPAPLDLETFCHSLISEIQTIFNHKQQINFIYQANQQKFNLDSKLLHHILTNLLSNACKYSPKDTVIDFEVCCRSAKIIFVIRDRGMGVPSEDIPQLFDSFYRASNSRSIQGTGLGLAIAKEYAEIHQGAIAIQSELDTGTTFTVTIALSSI
jgi:signal transduction histidine kinase